MQGRLYIARENGELKKLCDVQQAEICGIEVESQEGDDADGQDDSK